MISQLIFRQIDEGNNYHKPEIAYDEKEINGLVGIIEGGRIIDSFAVGIRPEEADDIIRVFQNLSSELGEIHNDASYFDKFSQRIRRLQEDLKEAEQAYNNSFKQCLKEKVIKPLENGIQIPNGGRCSFCLSLR